MQNESLAQPPLETSLMGVVRGVADHYGLDASTPWLYGVSGHAFVANVHAQLCPSGPYCWKGEAFERLLANAGLVRRDLGFLSASSTEDERAAVEREVRDALGRGLVCALVNMDNQLITGTDTSGFTLAEPWGECVHTPPHLSFTTWQEFGDEIHANFYTYEKTAPANDHEAVRESLQFAVDLYAEPARFTFEHYGIGPDAYVNWISAVQGGHGNTHGAWWNGRVWSECRKMAGRYLREVAERLPETAKLSNDLASHFDELAESLHRASERDVAADEKIAVLEDAAACETNAIMGVEAVLSRLGSTPAA